MIVMLNPINTTIYYSTNRSYEQHAPKTAPHTASPTCTHKGTRTCQKKNNKKKKERKVKVVFSI